MKFPPHFILVLHHIFNNVLYVEQPPNVIQGVACFTNNTNTTLTNSCEYMRHTSLQHNRVFAHNLQKHEENSNFFKIIYYFPNNTFGDSSWIEKRINCSEILKPNCSEISVRVSKLPILNYAQINSSTTKEMEEKISSCHLLYILNVITLIELFALISILAIIFYKNTT